MKRVCLLLMLVLVCAVTPAQTQHRTTFEQITVADTAIGITAAIRAGMAGCLFRVETAQIRWRIDSAPTASAGTILEIGDVLTLGRAEDLMMVKFIRTGSVSGSVAVNCWTSATP